MSPWCFGFSLSRLGSAVFFSFVKHPTLCSWDIVAFIAFFCRPEPDARIKIILPKYRQLLASSFFLPFHHRIKNIAIFQ
jgi:hypothetical protein